MKFGRHEMNYPSRRALRSVRWVVHKRCPCTFVIHVHVPGDCRVYVCVYVRMCCARLLCPPSGRQPRVYDFLIVQLT